jgi:hypothetical protein
MTRAAQQIQGSESAVNPSHSKNSDPGIDVGPLLPRSRPARGRVPAGWGNCLFGAQGSRLGRGACSSSPERLHVGRGGVRAPYRHAARGAQLAAPHTFRHLLLTVVAAAAALSLTLSQGAAHGYGGRGPRPRPCGRRGAYFHTTPARSVCMPSARQAGRGGARRYL